MGDRLKAVLFDVDGTLVDSNDAHAAAWVKAFTEHGITVDPALVRRCIGMGGDKLMPAVSGLDEESPKGAAIACRTRARRRPAARGDHDRRHAL